MTSKETFVPGYSQEELDAIHAQHKAGRLMPFIELPLLGGMHIVRLLRKNSSYVLELGPEEATNLLRVSNPYTSREQHMTTVIEMAREAGIEPVIDPIEGVFFDCYQEELERFAELVRAEENEACALIADEAEPYNAADLIRKRMKK